MRISSDYFIIAGMKGIIALFACILIISCQPKKSEEKRTENFDQSTVLKYASGFRVSHDGHSKLVEVLYPFQGATSGYRYLLVPKGEAIPPHDADIRIIRTPLNSIACTSTTHIPLLDYLGETNKLTGFTSSDYISSEKMRERID